MTDSLSQQKIIKPAIVAFLVGALSGLPAPARAATPDHNESYEQSIEDELKADQDLTILKRRIWFDSEWDKCDGSNEFEETLGGLWAWRMSPNQDWGVRFKFPLEFHFAGDTAGDSNDVALGDIKLAIGTAWWLNESWRAALGLEMRFPSATDDRLGDNAWEPQLFGALAWDITSKVSFSPSFEYNKSIAEEHDAEPKNFIEMFFPVTWILPNHWSVAAQYEAKVDFENDNSVTNSGKLILAKRFEGPVGVSLSIKKPFDNGNKEFQVNLVATYYFSSKDRERPKTK